MPDLRRVDREGRESRRHGWALERRVLHEGASPLNPAPCGETPPHPHAHAFLPPHSSVDAPAVFRAQHAHRVRAYGPRAVQRGPRWRSDRQRRAAPADADDEDLVRRRSRRKGAPALRLSSGPCPAAAASWHRRRFVAPPRPSAGSAHSCAREEGTRRHTRQRKQDERRRPSSPGAADLQAGECCGAAHAVPVRRGRLGDGRHDRRAGRARGGAPAVGGRRPRRARHLLSRGTPQLCTPRHSPLRPSSPVPLAGARRDAGDEATRRGGAVRRRGGGGRQRGGGAAKARGQVCGQAGGQAGGKTGQESGWRAEGGGLGVHALVQG